jgi:hypothetical protein
MDALALLTAAGFFVLTWGLVRLCAGLSDGGPKHV